MANENGYVVYPASVGFMNLEAALDAARLDSNTGPEWWARVEDCDTEETVAQFIRGEQVAGK